MHDAIEPHLSRAEQFVAEWQREFAELNRSISTFTLQCESRLAIMLDSFGEAFKGESLQLYLEGVSAALLEVGTKAIDALWSAMQLIEKVQKLVVAVTFETDSIRDQFEIRISALMERISHGQSATLGILSDAKEAFIAFNADEETIHERRVQLLLTRLDSLPWKRRRGQHFDFLSDLDDDRLEPPPS